MKIQRRVLVRGKVQGVGFRASTAREAQNYSRLCGYVRNLTDGSVEAVFAGEEKEVLSMVAWCRRGPTTAHVTGVEVKEEECDTSLSEFKVSLQG
jgi:acylphosphatase